MPAGPGTVLGKYQLIAEIARGGMGIVYLALVSGPGGFNKLVVIKELKPDLVEEPAFLTMFLDEARLAARLNHANIVQTNEVGADDHRYFMAMEYLDGRALDRVRRRARSLGTRLPLAIQARIICDVLVALEYAHQLADFDGTPLNIVHRDISPQNVFVTFDGQVKLLDFGIAKAHGAMHETNAGVLKGKVSYMAPEQARGQRVDVRADVFSAGVMLWEALTGRRLREGQNGQEILWALATGDLPRASTVEPRIAPELDEICAKAMAWDRERRYQSAAELREALEGYLTQVGGIASAREVGQVAADMFREDRAQTNALIEQHIARARSDSAARGELPIIDVASSPAGNTPSNERSALTASGRAALTTGGRPRAMEAGAPPAPPAPPSLVLPVPVPAQAPMPEPIHADTASSLVTPSSVRLTGRTRAMRLALPALAAVAIIAIVLLARSKDTPASVRPAAPALPPTAAAVNAPPGAPVPASAEAPAAAPTRPAASPITVAITVSPADALVTIDGAEVAGPPVHAKYPADGVMHHIKATAPGYVAKTKAIAFDADVALEIKLEKVPASPAPQPPARVVAAPPRPAPARAARAPDPPAPPAQAEPDPPRKPEPPRPAAAEAAPASGTKPRRPIDTAYPPDVSPAGGTKPRRPIDASNPYGAQ